jgi:hypothetical protein
MEYGTAAMMAGERTRTAKPAVRATCYHWMNNQGVIAGTKTETSPGYDWREMITLP